MKRLGVVLHSIDKLLIIRADNIDVDTLSPGLEVFTKKMKNIGKIKEVFGPVTSPYISVSISNRINGYEIIHMKNQRVYIK